MVKTDLLCPAGTPMMRKYKLVCEIVSATGCEVFKEGNKFDISADGVDLKRSDAVCVYSLMSVTPYLHSLLSGIDITSFGPGFSRTNDPDELYVQCLDPGYPCSTGGHVLIRITRKLKDSEDPLVENTRKEDFSHLSHGMEKDWKCYQDEQVENNAIALDFDYRVRCDVISKGENCGIYKRGNKMTISGANLVINETDALCPFAMQSIMPFVWPLQRKQITPAQIGMFRKGNSDDCNVDCPNPGVSDDDRTIFLMRRFPEQKHGN